MSGGVSPVVKKNKVKMAGTRDLSVSSPQEAQGAPGSGGANARILQQTDTEAVIEVLCDCGRQIHLHCNYVSHGG